MAKDKTQSKPAPEQDDLNNTDIEAPGGTQATHSSTGTGQAGDTGGPRVTRARESVVRGFNTVRDTGRNYIEQNDVNDIREDLEDRIRAHPVASIAIAVLGGYLLAKIVD